MDRLKYGVVGAVAWDSEFVRIHSDHPEAEVVALCDVKEEALGGSGGPVRNGKVPRDSEARVRGCE